MNASSLLCSGANIAGGSELCAPLSSLLQLYELQCVRCVSISLAHPRQSLPARTRQHPPHAHGTQPPVRARCSTSVLRCQEAQSRSWPARPPQASWTCMSSPRAPQPRLLSSCSPLRPATVSHTTVSTVTPLFVHAAIVVYLSCCTQQASMFLATPLAPVSVTLSSIGSGVWLLIIEFPSHVNADSYFFDTSKITIADSATLTTTSLASQSIGDRLVPSQNQVVISCSGTFLFLFTSAIERNSLFFHPSSGYLSPFDKSYLDVNTTVIPVNIVITGLKIPSRYHSFIACSLC